MKIVNAKSAHGVPSILGLIGAFLTIPFGVLIESIEIKCGDCNTDFTIRCATTDTRYAKCPACGSMNRWEHDN